MTLSYSVWESTFRFLPTTYWIKLLNFLHSLPVFSCTPFQQDLLLFHHIYIFLVLQLTHNHKVHHYEIIFRPTGYLYIFNCFFIFSISSFSLNYFSMKKTHRIVIIPALNINHLRKLSCNLSTLLRGIYFLSSFNYPISLAIFNGPIFKTSDSIKVSWFSVS